MISERLLKERKLSCGDNNKSLLNLERNGSNNIGAK
jgi:hypothetical protein